MALLPRSPRAAEIPRPAFTDALRSLSRRRTVPGAVRGPRLQSPEVTDAPGWSLGVLLLEDGLREWLPLLLLFWAGT